MNLYEKFGIETENEMLYKIAFTHGSYSTKHHLGYTYERLEFLGDSVLSLIVSEYLYNKYPHYEEGKLTKLRANFVCQNALIYYSHELGLHDYLNVSAEESNLTKNEILSITADIFESFLGAIFLDQGLDFAKEEVSYKILKEYGVPHDKTFVIAIMVDGEEMGVGKGKNKKEAEQAASKVAIEKLGVLK